MTAALVAGAALVASSAIVAPAPEPPFAARLIVDSAYVRAAPRAGAPEVGCSTATTR
jgi:hypothetical protein